MPVLIGKRILRAYIMPVLEEFGYIQPEPDIQKHMVDRVGQVEETKDLCMAFSITEEEAVKTAKGIDFGLVASIWSKDGVRQMRLAKRLRAGQVFINNYGAGGGVELPFGGVGLSGHGREKGFEALYCFSTLETVAAHHG